jgi:exodeoxyribonuclease-5
MEKVDLTDDQKFALSGILDWQKNLENQILTLGGSAGSGKTTLIRIFKELLDPRLTVAFCAFTGKAASVLSTKLKMYNCLNIRDYCGTVHSLIYVPVIDPESNDVIDWKKKEKLDFDLIILDEASMINEYLFEDLKSYDIPILCVGDHYQLPPIDGKLNLMASPDIKLTKIHRQAENDPIIQMSLLARTEGFIPYSRFGDKAMKIYKGQFSIKSFTDEADFKDSVILCGFNSTRVSLNQTVRIILNYPSTTPVINDRVICLKNNAKAKNCAIYNGIQGTVRTCKSNKSGYKMTVDIDNESRFYKGVVSSDTFNSEKGIDRDNYRNYLDYFDYGYCISVHKSQGSEWDTVVLFEERSKYWTGDNWTRWLYTAVTRAKKKLIIIGQR